MQPTKGKVDLDYIVEDNVATTELRPGFTFTINHSSELCFICFWRDFLDEGNGLIPPKMLLFNELTGLSQSCMLIQFADRMNFRRLPASCNVLCSTDFL